MNTPPLVEHYKTVWSKTLKRNLSRNDPMVETPNSRCLSFYSSGFCFISSAFNFEGLKKKTTLQVLILPKKMNFGRWLHRNELQKPWKSLVSPFFYWFARFHHFSKQAIKKAPPKRSCAPFLLMGGEIPQLPGYIPFQSNFNGLLKLKPGISQ